ncbi:MAG: ferritin-like domain-containing protein [Polyangiaceae bacterium]|nr:ferritin-like domain-containing protein [Polyangiaceae bacterium]
MALIEPVADRAEPAGATPRWRNQLTAYGEAASLITEVHNPKVLATLLPSALRGFVAQRGKQGVPTLMPSGHETYFDWNYTADKPQMRELYRRAKQNQWDGETALDWSIDVDPMNPEVPLVPYEYFASERIGRKLGATRDSPVDLKLRYELTTWMLSQFLHGEQGALHAAAQVTESVQWMDGKFYAATQVMDEARHVEVFHRYLETKLGKLYVVNDNLFVIIDALMHDARWDMKFLGMQLMIEGLALGAFGMLYKLTAEPLLKSLLRNVIQDEARHVHFGVVALREHYQTALSPSELRERQDWAFEVALLMRNRFMAHEVYEEHFAASCSRKEWNELVLTAPGMNEFRHTMFERLVPNLRFVGLLDARMAEHYAAAGLLRYAGGKDASQLSGDEMLAELDRRGAAGFVGAPPA